MSAISEATRPIEKSSVVHETRAARKRVVIVGAGFAGLAAAHALRHADVEVVLIDRRNHHIFQPLLYQVAKASIILLDAGNRVLPTFVEPLSRRVTRRLTQLGVKVLTGVKVETVDQ
jgi:NADH dehydrogenase FAD-containing subunit